MSYFHRIGGQIPRPTQLVCTVFLLIATLGAAPGLAAETASLSGTVETADGQAVADAHVQLVELRRHVDTKTDGTFNFSDLPAGRYLLRVEHLAAGELTRRIEIAEGEAADLTLRLAIVQHEDEILVTATGLNRSQLELAQPTTVLRGEDLQYRLSPTLGETLAQEAGISSTFFGQGASRPVIRGIGGDRIRILQDGVDVGDASSTSPDHAVSADPALAERIEVLRGPATLLYGSSAIGGVVNVIDGGIPTQAPEKPVAGFVDVGAGSVSDERRASASLTGGNDNWAWHVSGSLLETDNYEIPGFAEAGHSDDDDSDHGDDDSDHGDDDSDHGDEHEEEEIFGLLPNSDIENRSAKIGFTHFGRSGFLGVSVSGFDSLYGVPGGHGHGEEGHGDHDDDDSDHGDDDSDHDDDDSDHSDDDSDHGDDGHEEEEDIRIDLERKRFDLRGEITEPFGAFQGARLRIGAVDYEHTEFEGDEVGTRFFNDSIEGRVELVQRRRGDHEGSFGFQFLNKELEAIGAEAFIPKSDSTTWALFTFQEIERLDGALTWQLGARLENQSTSAVGNPDRDFDGLSASLGLVWRPADGWSIATSLARSTKLPNAEELYSNGPHPATRAFEIGDPNLDEETSLGFDVAIRRTAGRFTGELSIYRNTFDDYIFQAFTGEEEDGFDVLQYRQADATFEGAELEARVALWERNQAHFDISFTADMVDAEFDAGGNLPRIPPQRLGVGLHFHQPTWHGYVEAWDVDAQNDVADNETPTEGYTMINAGLSYRFFVEKSVVDLILRGRNLGDEDARNHVSFLKDEVPLPGRDYSLSARWSF